MGSLREAEKFSFGLVGMVLDVIAKGLSSPLAIAQAVKDTWRQESDPDTIKRTLRYAHTQGYLTRFGQARTFHYQLSPAGERRLAQLSFRLIKFDPQTWDGQWRVLIFDIPESRRTQRDMVRHLIRQLGMRRLQKSVWVTPADCRTQFEQLRQAYGINQTDMLLLEVKNTPALEHLKNHWW